MAALTAALVGTTAYTAYAQSQAQRAQGDYQNQMAQTNAKFAGLQAADAISRGDQAATIQGQKTQGLLADQRAGMAAQGIDLSSGSAAEVQKDSSAMGALDALTIRNNAFREAWGYQMQGANFQAQGAFASMAGNNSANMSLLTGGLQAANSGWQSYYATKGSNNVNSGNTSGGYNLGGNFSFK